MKHELEHFYIGRSYGGNQDWFLINGYEERDDTLMVKAVTYSSYQWLDLRRLWDTGYANKGGLILYKGLGQPE